MAADTPKSNWRCKACHGWDYQGANGAYQSGKHATGINGIDGAAGRNVDEIVALLKAPEHGYGLCDWLLTQLEKGRQREIANQGGKQ